MNKDLQHYIETRILPLYEQFDPAHGPEHVHTVIEQSLRLADIVTHSPDYRNADGSKTTVRPDMAYTIAAYHDLGLCEGRDRHHIVSARIIRNDEKLREWFTPEEIDIMADAAEDHRASSTSAPRSPYGCIVSEADRTILPREIIRRTIQFGLSNYTNAPKDVHYLRTIAHLKEKYAEGGYLKLWIKESDNAHQLQLLRDMIRDEVQLKQVFEEIWTELTA